MRTRNQVRQSLAISKSKNPALLRLAKEMNTYMLSGWSAADAAAMAIGRQTTESDNKHFDGL